MSLQIIDSEVYIFLNKYDKAFLLLNEFKQTRLTPKNTPLVQLSNHYESNIELNSGNFEGVLERSLENLVLEYLKQWKNVLGDEQIKRISNLGTLYPLLEQQQEINISLKLVDKGGTKKGHQR